MGVVDPGRPRRFGGASGIHGLTAADVAGAFRFPELIPELMARLAGGLVVAHHAAFDVGFLAVEYARAGHVLPELAVVCTYEASVAYLPGLGRRWLADYCAAAGVALLDAHTAMGDARAPRRCSRSTSSRWAEVTPRAGDVGLLAYTAAVGPAPVSPPRSPSETRAWAR